MYKIAENGVICINDDEVEITHGAVYYKVDQIITVELIERKGIISEPWIKLTFKTRGQCKTLYVCSRANWGFTAFFRSDAMEIVESLNEIKRLKTHRSDDVSGV